MTILALLNEWMGLPELASEHGSMVDHMLEMVHWLMGLLLQDDEWTARNREKPI